MLVTFLEANIPLTKSFLIENGNLVKTPYPNVANFTSHDVEIEDITDFYEQIKAHGDLGHCLLKGLVQRPLIDESRAGSTDRMAETSWVCFDLDDAPFEDPDDFMTAIGLPNVSYVLQYSASYGLSPETDKLSAHLFAFLSAPVQAHLLKQWLTHMNLSTESLKQGLSLTRTGAALHWPLDITACQNDKLLYIAPPTLGKGVVSKLKAERIQLVKKSHHSINTATLKFPNIEQLRKETRTTLNDLRKAAGLEILRAKTSFVGEYELQKNPGAATITGIKNDRGFMYFNLNGGNSWAYYHPEDNAKYLYNFKGEPIYVTEEILPEYYADWKAQRSIENAAQTEDGLTVLCFRDFQTSTYWNGTWSEGTKVLRLAQAKSELQLKHFAELHGRLLDGAIPVWDMRFDPQSETIVDASNRVLNTYAPPALIRQFYEHSSKSRIYGVELPETCARVIKHAVGEGEVMEHFLNWLAVIYQKRVKTLVAWILHGTQGTGKGILINKIIAPTLGPEYVALRRASELEEPYNGWMERSLLVFVDEMKQGKRDSSEFVNSNIKNMITEPVISVRHMHRQAYNAQNFSNFLFASNENDPVHVPPDDRRFNVGVFQPEKLIMSNKEMDALEKDLYRFVKYIMTRPADVDLACQILHTQDRQQMIEVSRTSVDMIASALLQGDLELMYDSMPDPQVQGASLDVFSAAANAFSALITNIIIQRKESDRLTRDELRVVFEYCVGGVPRSPNKFTSFLRHHGIRLKRIRKNGVLTQGIEIAWKYDETWFEERRKEIFERHPNLKAA